MRGFTLLSLIVTVAILSIVILTFSTFVRAMERSLSSARARASKDSIVRNLSAIAASPTSLKQSVTSGGGQSALARCVQDSAQPDCRNEVFEEFDLYDTFRTRVAGTTAKPVYYSTEGATCLSPSASCRYQATARFKAKCASGSSCAKAVQLDIEVTVSQLDTLSAQVVGETRAANRTIASTVDVAEIAQSGAQSCPPGQMMVGIDTYGKIQCAAMPASDHFGGAWACQLNTANLKCGGCLAANPMTGGCSCPAGYQTLKVTGCDANLYRCGFVCAK